MTARYQISRKSETDKKVSRIDMKYVERGQGESGKGRYRDK